MPDIETEQTPMTQSRLSPFPSPRKRDEEGTGVSAFLFSPSPRAENGLRQEDEGLGDLLAYRAFAAALLNPERETPSAVSGPHGKTASKRYDVYRNNVTVSLINALAAIFPATRRITGEDFFRAMARFHMRATPPTSPLLFEYGRDFPAFIETYEHAQGMPWLGDVARIERAWLDAYHAADAAPLDPELFASIPPEYLAEIVLVPHAATRILSSVFPAVTIFAMNRGDSPVGAIEAVEPEDALITRPRLEVFVRRLPPGGAVFLTHLIDGRPLGQAAAAAFDDTPDFDLAANIAGIVEAGAFIGISQGA